jgi:hypothetical protein
VTKAKLGSAVNENIEAMMNMREGILAKDMKVELRKDKIEEG